MGSCKETKYETLSELIDNMKFDYELGRLKLSLDITSKSPCEINEIGDALIAKGIKGEPYIEEKGERVYLVVEG